MARWCGGPKRPGCRVLENVRGRPQVHEIARVTVNGIVAVGEPAKDDGVTPQMTRPPIGGRPRFSGRMGWGAAPDLRPIADHDGFDVLARGAFECAPVIAGCIRLNACERHPVLTQRASRALDHKQ